MIGPNRHVVIAGWSGTDNLGDELLLRALLGLLAELGWSATVVSGDPEGTTATHGVPAIAMRNLPGLWRAVRSSDGIVLGPGTIIQDQTSPVSLPWHLSRVLVAAAARRPVVGVGLGVGPLTRRGSSRLVGAALGRARSVAVRDAGSAALLEACGVGRVEVGCDLAFALPAPTGPVLPRVAVCLRPFDPAGSRLPLRHDRRSDTDRQRIIALAAALDDVADRTGLPVHFVAMDTGLDPDLHAQVAERMRTPSTAEVPDLDGVVEAVGSSELVVAMRFHAGVAAVLGGRPAVLIGYAPKVDSLAALVGDGMALVGDDAAGWNDLGRAASEVLGQDARVATRRDDIRPGIDAHRRALTALSDAT